MHAHVWMLMQPGLGAGAENLVEQEAELNLGTQENMTWAENKSQEEGFFSFNFHSYGNEDQTP